MSGLYLAAGALIGSGILGTIKGSSCWGWGTAAGIGLVVLAVFLENVKVVAQ